MVRYNNAVLNIRQWTPTVCPNARDILHVYELLCSQEDNPGTSKSPRETEKVTGTSRCSVRCREAGSATECFQMQEGVAAV